MPIATPQTSTLPNGWEAISASAPFWLADLPPLPRASCTARNAIIRCTTP